VPDVDKLSFYNLLKYQGFQTMKVMNITKINTNGLDGCLRNNLFVNRF